METMTVMESKNNSFRLTNFSYKRNFFEQKTTVLSSKQTGFTLIELTIVAAIIMILAVVMIPNLNNYLIESKIPKVAEEMQRFVARAKVTSYGMTEGAYTDSSTAQLANSLRGSGVFQVSGSGANAKVSHDLGRASANVYLSPSSIAVSNDAMALTFEYVSRAACPALATVMQKMADEIQINGQQVKSVGGRYQASTAENSCLDGDENTFVFKVR